MSHLWGQVKTSTGACILSVDPKKVACRLRRRWFTNWGASSLFRAGRTKSFSRWTRMSTTPCVWNVDLNVNGTNIRNNSTIWVLIRGEAYRTNRTTVQDEIVVRLNKHVIQAIRKSHSTSNIQPVFCLQRHTFNATLQYKLANVSKLPVSVTPRQSFESASSLVLLRAKGSSACGFCNHREGRSVILLRHQRSFSTHRQNIYQESISRLLHTRNSRSNARYRWKNLACGTKGTQAQSKDAGQKLPRYFAQFLQLCGTPGRCS